ncbi:MAG: alpha/beta hydrolase [Faecousia sp.]
METLTFDVYEACGLERPRDASGGLLRLWSAPTPDKVSTSRRRPGILILPGGGYRYTSPREAEPVALRFLARGFVPFVLDYSCAPCGFPVALREAAMAMRFIRENAHRYEIDPGMVTALGFSAGGHLCGCLGTMFDCPEAADIGPAGMLRPDALAMCYPVAVSWGETHDDSFLALTRGDASLRGRLSLEKLVRRDMPPVFLWHTRNDGSVNVRNSLILSQALEEQGVDFAMHIYRSGPHGLSTADPMSCAASSLTGISWDIPSWVEALIRFLAEKGIAIQDDSAD